MLSDIKKELFEKPDKIIQLLEHYEFCYIKLHGDYISCARDSTSSPKSITIWLRHNEGLFVKDWARNTNSDIFSFIVNIRGVELKDVINETKNALGISNIDVFDEKHTPFGGYFDKFYKKKESHENTVYPESILDEYKPITNLRFFKDHISIATQMKYGVRFDPRSNLIIIPIRDQIGRLIGIKGRKNYDSNEDGFNKYIYVVPCQSSQTLFGYSTNYGTISGGTILIGESEKFVMQLDSYNYLNGLGLGSGSISSKQVKMILECHPKEVIFCHDVGYDIEYIERNMKLLESYTRFSEINIRFWNWMDSDFPDKASITDLGKEQFEQELKRNIMDY